MNNKFGLYDKSYNYALVSVLMTVYNREKYISEAIESVLASSYTNFELIIVDDQSTDRSVEIARKYETQDKRIKVYVNEQNLGQFPNRNKAASYAKGKYLKYLDSDDIIYPHGLEVMVWAIEKFPDAGFATMHHKPEDSMPYPIILSPSQAYTEHFLGRGVFDIGPSGCIFDTEKFNNVAGYLTDNYVGNDTELLFRIGALYPTVKMPTALIWWRQHEGQAFDLGVTSNEYLYTHFNLIIEILNRPNCPLPEQQKQKAIARQKQHHARKLLALAFKQKKIKLAWQAFKQSEMSFTELLKGFIPYI